MKSPPPPPPSSASPPPPPSLFSTASSGRGTKAITGDRCRATVWFPGPGVVATRVTGHIDGPTTTAIYAAVDARWSSEGPQADGFVDLGDLSDVDWDARTIALRWNLAHRAYPQRLHLLVGAPSVRLAARVFTLAFPRMMHLFDVRSAFEAEYARVVKVRTARAGTRPIPLVPSSDRRAPSARAHGDHALSGKEHRDGG